jgi:hypothetical protein
LNPTEWYAGYYQPKTIQKTMQKWSNLSSEMKELGITLIEGCLTREQAEDVIARANRRRGSEPDSISFRTLQPPTTDLTQTTKAVVSKENMKLNISRTALIAGLENYIKTETNTFTANLQAFNDAQAPIVAFIASQKAQVAKKNLVTEENVTPAMLSATVKSINDVLGATSNAPTTPSFSVVNTMLNKLALATDETIELDASDPILNFFNATK